MKPICFLLSADEDFHAAYERYEEEAPGKGDRFSTEVQDVLDLLERFPMSGSVYFRSTRKMRVRKFPYAILYVVERDRVAIRFIVNLHANPDAIRRRIVGND